MEGRIVNDELKDTATETARLEGLRKTTGTFSQICIRLHALPLVVSSQQHSYQTRRTNGL